MSECQERTPGAAERLVRDTGALVAIACVVAWLYWQPLFQAGVWIPAGGGDLASLIYPNYRFAFDSLRTGDFPFWNPYIQSGVPFAADIQSGLLYPVNLLAFAILPRFNYAAVTALALGHVWLAGALAYVCGRGLGLNRWGALFAGVVYALSDFFVVHIGNLNLIAVAAWLPLLLLASIRTAACPSARWIGVGGFALAMAALAGHVQPLLYGLVMVGLVGVSYAWTFARHRRFEQLARSAAALVAMCALGLAAAAVQLIPAAELTSLSLRAAIPYETSIEYSLPPGQLISWLVPGFFGRGPDTYWGQWLRTETGYVGVATLVFAGIGVAAWRKHWLTATTVVGVGLFLIALGGYSALHGLLYRFAPLFGSLRAPARAILVVDLAVALAAGAGVALAAGALSHADRRVLGTAARVVWRCLAAVAGIALLVPILLLLYRENPALPRATGIAEGWLLFLLWLFGVALLLGARITDRLRPTTFGLLAVGWVALDLVGSAQGLELTRRDPRVAFERPPVLGFLASDPAPFRIDTDTGIWDVWQPNTAMVQRVPDVVGGIHPLELADFKRYWGGLGSRSTPLYDLMNARYAIARKDVPLDWNKFQLAFDGDPEMNVYRNTRALPRAFLVGASVRARDHEDAYALIHAPDFDPSRTVVLEDGEPIAASGDPGAATVVEYRTSSVVVDVAPATPAYLVLAEVWYPGWQATVDGRPATVQRADFLFRAVKVNPGDRRVVLTFEPTGWRPALAVTLLSWLAILLLVAGGSPRRVAHTLRAWTGATRRDPGSASAS